MDDAGDRHHQRHEIDERSDRYAQHFGGVAVAGDLAGLDPHPPGEPQDDEAAHEIDEAAQQPAAAGAEQPCR